jgi:glutathione S-transferase
MLLYTSEGSRGFRVSWTAAELGLKLEYRMLPFPPRAHRPDYLDINPLGTVPLLVDGDLRLTESTAIAHYLATRAGASDLIVTPDEPDYGNFLDYLHHADATLTFPQAVFLRFAVFERHRGLGEAGEAYGRWFGARLIKLEQRLDGRHYLCADRFTIADIASCYALWLARLLGLDSHFGPNVAAYLDRQVARPGFVQAIENERLAGEDAQPSVTSLLGALRESGN